MIPIELQNFLVEEIKELFATYRLDNPIIPDDPEATIPEPNEINLNVYAKCLPDNSYDNPDLFPFVTVKLLEGSEQDFESARTCKVVILAGTKDESDDYQGVNDAENIINKIYNHLRSKGFIGKYSLEYPVLWSTPDEDSYPYYFVALETSWNVPKVERKDEAYL